MGDGGGGCLGGIGGVVSLGGRAVWPRARVSWRGETLGVLEGDIGWCWGLGWVE